MDKQNNSNLDALLNNLIENFGEDDPVTQKVESLMEENVNLLLVGATGSGKCIRQRGPPRALSTRKRQT